MSKSIPFCLFHGTFWTAFIIYCAIRYDTVSLCMLPANLALYLWALYLYLERSEKGRAFLDKLHIRSRKEATATAPRPQDRFRIASIVFCLFQGIFWLSFLVYLCFYLKSAVVLFALPLALFYPVYALHLYRKRPK